MNKVLTIAGSDSSGGAGIQADIKTITAHGMYAMSAITSLTAQNTTGVYAVQDATPDFLAKELDCIFTDIFPDAVKVGMLSSPELVHTVAEKLKEYQPKNVVIDPVMVSTSGCVLLRPEAMQALMEELLPLADIITPNLAEAKELCGFAVETEPDMIRAAEAIYNRIHSAVLIKGGHLHDTADDLLYDGGETVWLRGERIENPNTHGTGCTLSSAIACELAQGKPLAQATADAKAYLTGALRDGLDLGHASGPLNHCWNL